jgi:hypothetical protein
MRSALVLTRNSRDAVTQGHALHRNAVTQGHALHRNAVTQRHALLRDAVTQLTLPCASFSRASSSRFSVRVWRHCLRELQLMHTQNANLQMRIRSRRQALLPGHVAVMQADYALLGIGAGDRATRAAHRRRGRHPVNRCQRPQSIAARLSGSKPSERRRRARESLHKSLILFVFF